MKIARRLLLVVSAILLLRLYTGGYDDLLSRQVRKYLKSYSVPCDFSALSLLPVMRPTFKGVRCYLPHAAGESAESFTIDEVTLSFKWLQLLTLEPTFQIYGSALGGIFEFTLGRSILSSETQFELNIGGTRLERMVQPKGLSLAGEVYAVLKSTLKPDGQFSGRGKLEITKGMISTPLAGGQLRLPAIESIEFSAPIVIEKGNLLAKPLSGGSSQGEIGGELKAAIAPPDFVTSYSAQIEVTLTKAGLRTIGGFLALAANKDVSKPAEEWLISITGRVPYTPNVQVREK